MSPKAGNPELSSFSEVVSAWPRMVVLSRDLGVPYDTVVAWKRRDFVPLGYWESVVASAALHKVPVTLGLLQRLAAGRAAERMRALSLRRRQAARAASLKAANRPRDRSGLPTQNRLSAAE
jgi:hypothetical protein